MTALFHNVKREFMIALVLHMCVLGVAVVFGNVLQGHQETVVVYLTDEAPGGGRGGQAGKAGLAYNTARSPEKISKKSTRSLSTRKAPFVNTARDTKEELKPSVNSGVSEGQANSLQTGAGEGENGGGFGNSSFAGNGGGIGGGHGRGTGTGKGADSSLKMQYLKEHFSQIRDLIMKHLSYPQMARKMGWKGKVIVAFIIRENGTVENTFIVRSSGYDILDSNALKTITDVQPFPKPPIKAELVIPIVYKLE